MMRYILVAVAALALTPACTASVGSNLPVPKDAASTCADQCSAIGMTLDSAVIMGSDVGCVCGANGSAGRSGAGAAAAGMGLIQQQQRAEAARRASR